MKKNIFTLVLASLLLSAAMISCDDILEPPYLGIEDDEDIWDNSKYTHGVLYKVYDNIYDDDNQFGIQDDYYSDNAVLNNEETRYAMGGDNASYYPLGRWEFHFLNISHVNQYLSYGLNMPINLDDTVPGEPVLEKLFCFGEAHFLRAWSESELLKQFAGPTDAAKTQMLGIPLLRRVFATDEITQVSRSNFDDCVQAIVNDLDTAIKYCPFDYDGSETYLEDGNAGRATQRGAKALKARVLLLAASPSYNIGNDVSKWEAAAEAAYEAIMMDGGLSNLGNLDDENDEEHGDVIWKTLRSTNNTMEDTYFPPSYYGKGRCNPSQNLVDAFPMANGCPISDVNGDYDKFSPYEDRDERFEAYIVHDGDPLYDYKTVETYIGGADAIGGLRTDATRTSYYMQRFTTDAAADNDPRIIQDGKSTSGLYFARLLDRQEVYLNFIEAANEVESNPLTNIEGATFSAYDAFQKVRSRGGSSALFYTDSLAASGGLTQDVFRDIIKTERRIEFCFRGFRYWDLRRWMEPLSVINADLRGMSIERDISLGVELFNYTETVVEYRRFKESTYYGPLPYSEVAKSDSLVQNYGW